MHSGRDLFGGGLDVVVAQDQLLRTLAHVKACEPVGAEASKAIREGGYVADHVGVTRLAGVDQVGAQPTPLEQTAGRPHAMASLTASPTAHPQKA